MISTLPEKPPTKPKRRAAVVLTRRRLAPRNARSRLMIIALKLISRSSPGTSGAKFHANCLLVCPPFVVSRPALTSFSCVSPQNIVNNHMLDVNVRWLAVLYFKNGIDRYWRRVAPQWVLALSLPPCPLIAFSFPSPHTFVFSPPSLSLTRSLLIVFNLAPKPPCLCFLTPRSFWQFSPFAAHSSRFVYFPCTQMALCPHFLQYLPYLV